jgi:hypothetical protein
MAHRSADEATPRSVRGVASLTRVAAFLRRLPSYAFLGALLNVLAWASSWARLGFWWPYTFFPLWLGFILVLDGLNVARTGTSPLMRGWSRFVMLFVYSAPFWWIFEGLNVPVQNWHYRLDHVYSTLAYVAITTLDFSTVLPAVMEMAELLASVRGLRPRLSRDHPGGRLSVPVALGLVALGGVLLWLPFQFPKIAFGMIWVCLIFLLDPINNLAGRKSAFGHLLAGDTRFFITLPLATLCCGFCWEMWNSRALPGWYYTVPGLDHMPHLFAMPLLGYLGYLPFGLELYAMYQFVLLITGLRRDAIAL